MRKQDSGRAQSSEGLVVNRDLALHSRTSSARKRHPEVQRNYIIPVLSKALCILDILEQAEGPVTPNQVARLTGYSLTTVYRILRTLSAHGFFPEGFEGIYTFRHVPEMAKVLEQNIAIRSLPFLGRRKKDIPSQLPFAAGKTREATFTSEA